MKKVKIINFNKSKLNKAKGEMITWKEFLSILLNHMTLFELKWGRENKLKLFIIILFNISQIIVHKRDILFLIWKIKTSLPKILNFKNFYQSKLNYFINSIRGFG